MRISCQWSIADSNRYAETRSHSGSLRISCVCIVWLIAGFFVTSVADAQHAGAFSHLGFGARGMALGNAQVADLSGKASAFYNPALAPFAASQALTGSIAALTFDREMQFLQFSTPIQPAGGISAGVVYAGVADIDGRDESGYHTESISSAEHALFVAFGTRFGERFSGGASITFYRARISGVDARAQGIALDLGATYRLSDRLHLGIVATDVLASYEWETADRFGSTDQLRTDRFPMRFRLGMSYLWKDNWTFFSEVELRQIRLHNHSDGNAQQLQHDIRVGASHQLIGSMWMHAGIDRVSHWQSSRPAVGFSLELPIGKLHLEAEYTTVYEQPVQGLAHILALTVDL